MLKTLTIKHGIIVFILCLITTAFVGYLAQSAFGIWGLAITEIIILGFAVLPALLGKQNFKDLFPIKAPKVPHLIGGLFVWLSAYIPVLLSTQITLYFFPEGFLDLTSFMQEFFTSTSFPVALIIVAVLPGVCEEFLHRGFIQYTQRALKDWQVVLLMGLIFGIFHLDPYRFLPTALLGAALTVVMLETKNLLIPIFIHFFNNALTLIVSFTGSGAQAALPNPSEIQLAIGAFIIISAFAPLLFSLGLKLLKGRDFKMFTLKRSLISLVVFLSCFSIGATVILKSEALSTPLFVTNMQMGINKETPPHTLTFEVTEAKDYRLSLAMSTEEGLIHFALLSESQIVIFETRAQSLSLTEGIFLGEGTYKLVYTFLELESQNAYATFKTEIKIE